MVNKKGIVKNDVFLSYIKYYEKIGSKIINITDEIPFEIPNNWCWSRIKNVTSYGNTLNLNPSQSKQKCWLLELEDIESSTSKILQRKIVNDKTNLGSKVLFKSGMILYSKLRPYLDKVLIADEDGIATSEIVPFYSFVDNEYAIIFFKSPYYLNHVKELMYGVKMPRLGTNDMQLTFIPIPTQNEQFNIVKKVILLFNYIK